MWQALLVVALAACVFGFMLLEAIRAARNEHAQRAAGGIEPAGDVYSLMRIAYPASFLAMITEGAIRGGSPRAALVAGMIVFAAAIVAGCNRSKSPPPAAKPAVHKQEATAGNRAINSRAVEPRSGAGGQAGEKESSLAAAEAQVAREMLSGMLLATGARASGPIALLVFATLLVKRITVEDRALRTSTR